MSGDVQPRKRKDKKRKRDSLDRKSEGELIFSRKASLQPEEEEIIHHGVHATKMGTEDVHLHVQSEHGTGGNWCAKIFFFSLMAILFGLVGLIIMENRGISDLDTPLKESRFSEYFEGWVDEQREEHRDDHNVVAHEIEEHDLHDEPFEEVEEDNTSDDDEEHDDHDDDQSTENDETVEDKETHEDKEEDDNDDDDDENEIDSKEDADVKSTEEDELDNENEVDDGDDDDDDDDEKNNKPVYARTKREAALENEPESLKDQSDENNSVEHNENSNDKSDENDDKENEDDNDESNQEDKKDDTEMKNDDDDPFDEEEYDGTFESLEESVVDNDALELRLLQKKAEQSAQNTKNVPENEESSSTPLAVKILIGLALALVARLVLIKKRPEDTTEDLKVTEDIINPTEIINSTDELFQDEENEPLDGDYYEEEEEEELYSDNDLEEEEIEEEEETVIPKQEKINNASLKTEPEIEKYIPETFEQLQAAYRPVRHLTSETSDPKLQVDVKLQTTKTIEFKPRFEEIKQPDLFESIRLPPFRKIDDISQTAQNISRALPKESSSISYSKIISPPQLDTSVQEQGVPVKLAEGSATEPPSFDDEEYAEDDIGDEEEMYEEEIEDEEHEELSDVDDDDLMQRLEAKYGKLPDDFGDDDEEEDEEEEEDASWTKIKPRSGGQQSYSEDDFIEDGINRANEHTLQDDFDFQ